MKKQLKKKEIIIPFTQGDLDDLRYGRELNWTFPTTDGSMEIDVILQLDEEEQPL